MDELERARRELAKRAPRVAVKAHRDPIACREHARALADAHVPLWEKVFVNLVRKHVNSMMLVPSWQDQLFGPGYTHWKVPGRRGGNPPVSIDHILNADVLGALLDGATNKLEIKEIYGMRVTEHMGCPFRVSWSDGMIHITSCYPQST